MMRSFCVSLTLMSTAAQTCPAGWVQRPNYCIWPFQQQYKNLSVVSASDQSAACCAACAADGQCVEWLVQKGNGRGVKPGTCILNNAIVQVDDLRPEITSFGKIPGTNEPPMHTPNIDALAAKSLVLLKNYVQQAVCSPTRASLLTGRRPDRTRTYDLYSYFRQVGGNFTTIPEFFKLHGYNTIGMGKIFHPGHASGTDDKCCSWSNYGEYFHATNVGSSSNNSWAAVSPKEEAAVPLGDNQTSDVAVRTLGKLAADYTSGADTRPFFLAVGFHRPHLPFIAPQQFFDLYPESSIQLPPNQQPPQGMPAVAWSSYGELLAYQDQKPLHASGKPGTLLPTNDTLALRRAYYASVSFTDFLVGKVMAALEKTPFVGNTVISFWGDHGWQLGEHGEWCKHTNFEIAARAPMIVHVPGLTDSGVTTSMFSEHVDLFPTLTEAAMKFTMPPCPPGDASFGVHLCTEGSSLLPLTKDPAKPVKTASFSQYPRGYQSNPAAMAAGEGGDFFNGVTATPTESPCIKDGVKGCTMGYTLVTRVGESEFRYTEWADFNTAGFSKKVNWARNVGIELYNHTSDPGENINLASTAKSDPAVVSVMATLSKVLRAGPDAARLNTTGLARWFS